MTIRETEDQLVDELNLLPDAQERLSYVVELGQQRPPLPPELKQDIFRVPGCQSQVWIVQQAHGQRFICDADSLMVKGLAWMLCDVYSAGTAEEAAAHVSTLLSRTRLDTQITPNRRRGMENVMLKLRELAR